MAEHTPGPWDLHHQSAELMSGDCDWSLQTEEAGAFLLFCHHPSAPAEANGRLIAAAPDLLATLLTVACPGGGWNGMPKELDISQGGVGATVNDCLTYGVCGCIYGDVVKKARP